MVVAAMVICCDFNHVVAVVRNQIGKYEKSSNMKNIFGLLICN